MCACACVCLCVQVFCFLQSFLISAVRCFYKKVDFSDLFCCLPFERLDNIAFPLLAKSSLACRVVCPVYLMFLQESMLVCEPKLQAGRCVFKTPRPTFCRGCNFHFVTFWGGGGRTKGLTHSGTKLANGILIAKRVQVSSVKAYGGWKGVDISCIENLLPLGIFCKPVV